MQHRGDFILQHLADRNPGPGRDHVAHNVSVHANPNQRRLPLQLIELAIHLPELRPQFLLLPLPLLPRLSWLPLVFVPFRGAGIRACRVGSRADVLRSAADPARRGFPPTPRRRRRHRFLNLPAHLANPIDQVPFLLPSRRQPRQPLFRLRLLRANRRNSLRMIGPQRRLPLQNAQLHRAIVDLPLGVLNRRRRRILPQRQPRARRIQHADSLIGKLPVRQVPVRQLHCRRQPLVQDPHVVMLLQNGSHAPHHQFALRFGGLLHLNHLEPPRQRRILLEVLLVFRPRSRRDGAQFPARQRRFQDIGSVVLPRRAARPDHGVRLIDEQHDRDRGSLHFLHQPLQPVFEFALDPRPRLQQRQVERPHRHLLQHVRHIAADDAHREPFDHRRLPHARFARENRVILPPPREDVDNLPDLEVAPQHRIDLPRLSVLRQVDGVLIQVGRLPPQLGHAPRRGRRGPCRRRFQRRFQGIHHDQRQGLAQCLRVDLLQFLAHLPRDPRELLIRKQRQQGKSGAHLGRVELQRANRPRLRKHAEQRGAKSRSPGISGLDLIKRSGQLPREPSPVDAELFEGAREIRLRRIHKLHEEVLDLDVIMSPRQAQPRRILQRLPRSIVQLSNNRLQTNRHLKPPHIISRSAARTSLTAETQPLVGQAILPAAAFQAAFRTKRDRRAEVQ